MNKRISAILCLGLLSLGKGKSYARTGEFIVGVNTKTTKIINGIDALKDYGFFKEDTFLTTANDDFKMKLIPLAVGINTGYSCFFTESLGLSFNGEFCYGNICDLSIKSESNGKNSDYKLEVYSLGCDLRLKYDFLKNTLNFEDYGRSGWRMDGSLGVGTKFFIGRVFKTNISTALEPADENDNVKLFNIGAVAGIAVTTPANIGVGLDAFYSFKSIFKKPETDQKKGQDLPPARFANEKNRTINYSTFCPMIQVGISIFYDFAPLINNHEEPSEIDIEKW